MTARSSLPNCWLPGWYGVLHVIRVTITQRDEYRGETIYGKNQFT